MNFLVHRNKVNWERKLKDTFFLGVINEKNINLMVAFDSPWSYPSYILSIV